jgi:hypothetical protein
LKFINDAHGSIFAESVRPDKSRYQSKKSEGVAKYSGLPSPNVEKLHEETKNEDSCFNIIGVDLRFVPAPLISACAIGSINPA